MMDRSRINLDSNTLRTTPPVGALFQAPDRQYFAKDRNAGRFPTLVGILWVMTLPLALVCLVGCGAFVAPKQPTAASTSPSVSTLRIATNALPGGTVQNMYSAMIVATGGVPPYSWTQTGRQLPSGLSLNPITGIISGTATSTGTFTIKTKERD